MAQNSAFGRVKLLSGLVLVATFAAGTLVGAGVHRWMRPPHRHPTPPMHLPLEELDLSPDQLVKAHAIIDGHRAELELILRGTFPRVRAVHAQIEAEVRAILTPSQRDRLDEIEASRPPPPPRLPMPEPPPPGPPPVRDRNE
jgi:Spy/CpxP family protein refolding chaperone